MEDVKKVIDMVSSIPLSEVHEQSNNNLTIKPDANLIADWRLSGQFCSQKLLCKVSIDLETAELVEKLKNFGTYGWKS